MAKDRKLDYSSLRDDLMDYYGTAMTGGFPMASMDVAKAERASESELESMARRNGFDLDRYTVSEDDE